jgi:hypothetical protein
MSILTSRLRAAVAALLLIACSGGQTAKLEPPAPVAAPITLPPMEPAVIALPVELSLAGLRAQIASQFPPTDSLDQAKCSSLGGIVCHQYVYRRDTLDLRMVAERVEFFTRVRYRGRVAMPGVGGIGSCGYDEPMRGAELRMSTALYWRTDWKLGSRNTTLGATLLDPCQITMLKVDASPLMKRVIDAQLRRVRQQVDSAIPVLGDFKPAADSLWRTMQDPTPLDTVALDTTNAAWLVMAPEGVSVAPLVGLGGLVTTSIVLTARPRVVIGSRPAPDVRPLPPLTLTRPASGMRIPVQIEVPFADLGKRMTALLAGEAAGQGLRVKEVTVRGASDSALIKVDVEGKLNGAFFLTGRFFYDEAARTINVHDLHYTVESSSAMTRLKVSLGAPLIKRALDQATGHGRLDIGAQLDTVQAMMTAELNTTLAPGMTISGAIRSMRVTDFFTLPNAWVLRVVLEGDAKLRVE